MPAVYVAIGSNIEPERNLALAVSELKRAFPDARFSSWYRNQAVGFTGDDFFNAVAGFSTELSVQAVIEILQRIEATCGRSRDAPRWAPRSMDIDILLYDGVVCDEPKLKLPRPDLLKRAYMLGPLAELAPEVLHPTAKQSIGELWRRFDQSSHTMSRLTEATSQHSGHHPPQESDR
jgi:2-amino-4-hydroxy-6-hydroxymethyldihydropteridine diphosphokinase